MNGSSSSSTFSYTLIHAQINKLTLAHKNQQTHIHKYAGGSRMKKNSVSLSCACVCICVCACRQFECVKHGYIFIDTYSLCANAIVFECVYKSFGQFCYCLYIFFSLYSVFVVNFFFCRLAPFSSKLF